MNEPDDFGLSPIQTLAHVADQTRTIPHVPFWKAWSAAVLSCRPSLDVRRAGDLDPSDPGADHHLESIRHVRIGGRLLLPPSRPLAGLVATHGYADVPPLLDEQPRWLPLVERGVAVLMIRVRGYAGSRLDCPDLTAHPTGYITCGLETPLCEPAAWSFSCAVADTLLACLALRRRLRGAPLFLHGESFGAALAVLAAAQLADYAPIDRLALALPSMGDWTWRVAHPPRGGTGIARDIHRFLHLHPARDILTTLRTLDAAIHARRVLSPTLCKLAQRDDIVPAPAAAAVFNALGADPGRKLRFITRYGHFDGGVADARRHAAFETLVDEFLNPSTSPDEFWTRSAGPPIPA